MNYNEQLSANNEALASIDILEHYLDMMKENQNEKTN